jgi:hypothetical protein
MTESRASLRQMMATLDGQSIGPLHQATVKYFIYTLE